MKAKIVNLFKRFYAVIKPYRKNLIDPLLKIIGIIIICALLVRFVSGNETLNEYASKNPDKAYATTEQEK